VDEIKNAIQRYLNSIGDGWSVTQYVVAMGLQRMDSEGNIESIPWCHAPDDQPAWQTEGLLQKAYDLFEDSEVESD
jgi:hypothetical protein